MSAWEGEDDVQSKTWSYLQSAIEEAVGYLLHLEYKNIIAVGKSFGGGLLLSYHNPSIKKKILAAPAVGVGDIDTFNTLKNVVLSEIPILLDIQLSKSFVHDDPARICIIHGTKDTVIPIENSRAAVAAAQNGKLVEIVDADHSFKTPQEEQELLEATRIFLSE